MQTTFPKLMLTHAAQRPLAAAMREKLFYAIHSGSGFDLS